MPDRADLEKQLRAYLAVACAEPASVRLEERALESITVARAAPAKSGRPPWRRLPIPRFGPLAIAAAVAIAVAIVGGTVTHVWQRGSVARRDNNANPSQAVTISLGVAPEEIAFTPGAAWIMSSTDNVLLRVDTSTNRVTQTIHLSNLYHMNAADGFVWLSTHGDNRYYRVDPRTGRVTQGDQHGAAFGPPMVAAGSVWLYVRDQLLRIDEQTGGLQATISIPDHDTSSVVSAGSIWLAGKWDVARVEARTGTVTAVIPVATPPADRAGLAANAWPAGAGFGSVWVVDSPEHTVSRIDPATNKVVAKINLAGVRPSLAIGTDAVWVADSTKSIKRIDPATNKVTQTITVATPSDAIAFGDGSVWLLNSSLHTLTRVQP
jgi:YVTN family beta-propeller protein